MLQHYCAFTWRRAALLLAAANGRHDMMMITSLIVITGGRHTMTTLLHTIRRWLMAMPASQVDYRWRRRIVITFIAGGNNSTRVTLVTNTRKNRRHTCHDYNTGQSISLLLLAIDDVRGQHVIGFGTRHIGRRHQGIIAVGRVTAGIRDSNATAAGRSRRIGYGGTVRLRPMVIITSGHLRRIHEGWQLHRRAEVSQDTPHRT